MSEKALKEGSIVYDGSKLWDEILKVIVAMPEQLFPVFRKVFKKEYPKGTSIVLLDKETSTFWESTGKTPGSTLMDIALRVGDTDYYHLECQMINDHEMVIRMFTYDVHFAITHMKDADGDTDKIILKFPNSAVIYPEKNNAIPDCLQCCILFSDGSKHIYKVPTVKIQTYSLKEIREQHLTLFLPYTMLRFRPRLKQKKKISEKELTEYLEEVILILKGEASAGFLTELQYQDYVRLIRHAAERVFAHHRELLEEVDQMTKPLIKLPSMEFRELEEELAKRDAEITEQKTEIARQKAENAKKDAEIQRLQKMLRLAGTN